MLNRAGLRQVMNAGVVALTPGRYRSKLVEWHPAPVAEGSFCVFTAADPTYLQTFGPAFVSSLLGHHPSVSVHFHLYDPDAESLSLVARWQERFPGARIGYSTERLPKKALLPPRERHRRQSWRSLFICCSRFLAAQRLHEDGRAPILLMDIDVLVAGKLDSIFAGADYALMPRLDKKNWCKRTLGGVVYASGSPEGRAFLDQACRHIRKFLSSHLYWFAFDQYALYRALLHMKGRQKQANFRALSEEDVSFDLSGSAPILYAKGLQKHQEAYRLRADHLASSGSVGG